MRGKSGEANQATQIETWSDEATIPPRLSTPMNCQRCGGIPPHFPQTPSPTAARLPDVGRCEGEIGHHLLFKSCRRTHCLRVTVTNTRT